MEYNFQCKDGLFLEPRLQEYLKKKLYYKKNHIMESVPLEQEFDISKEDIKRIKAFSNGDNIYDKKLQGNFIERARQPKSFSFNADAVYKADPRYQRLQKKIMKDKEAMQTRHDQGSFSQDYFKPITNFFREPNMNDNIYKKELAPLTPMDSRADNSRNIYECKTKFRSPQTYTDQTHFISENNDNDNDNNTSLGRIIGSMQSYGNECNEPYYERPSEMDTDFKMVIPNIKSNGKKSINSSSYRAVPYAGRSAGIRDIGIESDVKYSASTRGGKSIGYPNPTEHYYDYISKDLQDPRNVVNDRGISTRLVNKKVAHKREAF